MPTISAVTGTLLGAGELRASQRTGGFQVSALGARSVIVRWRAPENERGAAAGLAFVEEYAALLRDSGIRAMVTTEDGEPQVLCLPAT